MFNVTVILLEYIFSVLFPPLVGSHLILVTCNISFKKRKEIVVISVTGIVNSFYAIRLI